MPEKSAEAAGRYLVRTVEPDEWPAWDAFVHESPYGTLFHTAEWLAMTGTPFRIYGCYHEESLIAGMVVEIVGPKTAGHSYLTTSTDEVERSGNSSGQAMGHIPNCPHLGVVLPPPHNKYLTTLTYHRNILSSLAGHVRDEFVAIHSRMGPDVVDMVPFISAGYTISPRYTYRIDLSDLDVAWGNMTDKRRNDIRKAERDGFAVDDQASMQDILSLYKVALHKRRRAAQIDNMAERRDQMLRSRNQCRSFLVRDRSGEAVAGIYVVWDKRCAYYLFGGYGASVAHRGAVALAFWEAIRYAGSTLGLRQFDMLGAGVGPIERFMRDFGGRLTVSFVADYQRPSLSRDVRRAIGKLKAIIYR